jgi:hypothetical protein
MRNRRTLGLGLAGLALVAACGQVDDGGAKARAAEMRALAGQSFRQAGGTCDDADECARKEAGFAYAKRAALTDADDCAHKGDDAFVDGCEQYGYAIDAAVKEARGGL